jgi:hypothetical protein
VEKTQLEGGEEYDEEHEEEHYVDEEYLEYMYGD